MAVLHNVFGVAEVAERSKAIWTKRSEVGNPVLAEVGGMLFTQMVCAFVSPLQPPATLHTPRVSAAP